MSLREVSNSEKILLLNSIIKADLYFWEEKIYTKNTKCHATLHTRLDEMVNEILECQLNGEKQGNGSINSGLCGKNAFVTIGL